MDNIAEKRSTPVTKIGWLFILLLVFFMIFNKSLYAQPSSDTFKISASRKPKLVSTALSWSLGATLVPIALAMTTDFSGMQWLAVGGIIIGPSAGHFYAEQWGRGLASTAVRVGLVGIGFGLMLSDISKHSIPEDAFSEAMGALAFTFWSVMGCAVIDIVTLPMSVRNYNESIEKVGKFHIRPNLDMHDKKCGLSFVYSF